MMKYIGLFIVFSLSLSCAWVKKSSCPKTGIFFADYTEAGFKDYKIIRNDKVQIESGKFNNVKFESKFEVNWLSDCKFYLKLIDLGQDTILKDSNIYKVKTYVEILSSNKEFYTARIKSYLDNKVIHSEKKVFTYTPTEGRLGRVSE